MEDAFIFEKSRAVLLIDQLRQQQIGDKEIGKIAMIKKNILRLETSMTMLIPHSKIYDENQRNLFAEKQELNRIEQLIRAQNPWYYQSMLDTSFISLQTVQQRLLDKKNSKTILEFFHGDSAVYLLTIQNNQSGIKMIEKKVFEETLGRFSGYLENPELENQDYNGYLNCGRNLYQLIFSGIGCSGQIIISPDGSYFPFEALVSNNNSPNPVYFVTDHVVSYTYSVRYLLNDFSKSNSTSSGNFLGFAPVKFHSHFVSQIVNSDVSLEKIGSSFQESHTLLKIGLPEIILCSYLMGIK
jgi:hypothetical protein